MDRWTPYLHAVRFSWKEKVRLYTYNKITLGYIFIFRKKEDVGSCHFKSYLR